MPIDIENGAHVSAAICHRRGHRQFECSRPGCETHQCGINDIASGAAVGGHRSWHHNALSQNEVIIYIYIMIFIYYNYEMTFL